MAREDIMQIKVNRHSVGIMGLKAAMADMAQPPSLSLRRVSEFRNSEAGGYEFYPLARRDSVFSATVRVTKPVSVRVMVT